jgi:hypothetical protein
MGHGAILVIGAMSMSHDTENVVIIFVGGSHDL